MTDLHIPSHRAPWTSGQNAKGLGLCLCLCLCTGVVACASGEQQEGGGAASAAAGDSAVDPTNADSSPDAESSQSGDEGTNPTTESGASTVTPADETDSGSSTSSDDDGNDDDINTWKWDLGPLPDYEPVDDDLDFSYIWISNSVEGTVSKIDTATGVELARYRTGPLVEANPSRTSVNLNGNAAVVNRNGGVTKIMAKPESCVDQNGDNQVTTSQGPNNVLEWGQDDCVVWYTALPWGSRPAAWTTGEIVDMGGKKVSINAKLWTSAPLPNSGGSVDVNLHNGDTGMIEDKVRIRGIASGEYGLYGGAVDSNNDLWAITLTEGTWDGKGWLIHVSRDDLQDVEQIQIPMNQAYGIMVDSNDRVWTGSTTSAALPGGLLQRYDPINSLWEQVDLSKFSNTRNWWIRGMMQGPEQQLYAAVTFGESSNTATGGGILRVDVDTMEAIEMIDRQILVGVRVPNGISIDAYGMVWMVDEKARGTGGAYRYDPGNPSDTRFIDGLNSPYTYSDMTGFGLRTVIPPG